MKSIFGVGIISLALMMIGCVSASRDLYYSNLAKEKSFDYFFPVSNYKKTFTTIDEAYEFVKTASLKFSQNVSNKRRDKGLAAKLQCPRVNDSPVTLICLIRASNTNGAIDLSTVDIPMEILKLKHLVFWEIGMKQVILLDGV